MKGHCATSRCPHAGVIEAVAGRVPETQALRRARMAIIRIDGLFFRYKFPDQIDRAASAGSPVANTEYPGVTMYKSLSAIAAIALLAACGSSATDERRADAAASAKKNAVATRLNFSKAVERLDVPLTECFSFLETGSFEPESLTSAGFVAQNFTLGTGTVYTMPTSGKYDLKIGMVEPKAGNQVQKCSINGSPLDTPVIPALEEMGFDVAIRGKSAFISRGEQEFELTGTRYFRSYDRAPSSPIYFTIKNVKS